jgi:hypothetical protein
MILKIGSHKTEEEKTVISGEARPKEGRREAEERPKKGRRILSGNER